MTPIPHHPYVSHLVRVAPRPAGIGLDFARSCLMAPPLAAHAALVGGTPPVPRGRVDADDERPWAICTPAGTLGLGGPFQRVVPRPRGYRPLRVATGALHPAGRGLRPVEVTLELLPWSSRWSELALISGRVRRSDCRRRAERAYLQSAHAALERLTKAIETPPAEWLARLVAGQPLPQSEHLAVVRWPDPDR